MDFKLIGSPCGQHGPYTFYKAFKYTKHGKSNILALSEFFFVKLWNDSDLVSIGELQLLWEDKNSEQTLASLRLYILPENTPEGRSDCHGEHEVLAITEKVVLRVEDLLTWITEAADWSWGLSAVYDKKVKLMPRPSLLSDNSYIDLTEVDKEKDLLGETHWATKSGVVVLSYPRYCRYRSIVKRLEGVHNKWLREALVVALGGFTVPCRNTRVLFCKDTFDYPDLEGHELLCNHLAPKLKGRPRKKRKVMDISPGSSDTESEVSSASTSSSSSKVKNLSPQRPMTQMSCLVSSRRTVRPPTTSTDEKDFLTRLYIFMRSRQTPINRVPTIGFRELDLYKLYSKVRHLGGYDTVSASRLWKYVYEEMGGDQSSTSAATCCRRHYERLLLPFERYIAPNRSKNPALAKLKKKYQEISITTKSCSVNDKFKNVPIKNGQSQLQRSRALDIVDLTSDPKPSEIVDLVSESDDSPSPVKTKHALFSSSKKQKLEILKEGGLEVTAITTTANGRPAPTEKHRPSVIQHVPPNRGKGKVSITITPDIHMLANNTQRHAAHAWSQRCQSVYGNPKETVHTPSRNSTDEILDLRTKSPFTPVGSNLEITLISQTSSVSQNRTKRPQLSVPIPPKLNHQQSLHHREPPQKLQVQRPVLKVPSLATTVSNGRGSNIVPNVSISVNKDRRKGKVTTSVNANQSFPTYKPGSFSFMDPMYVSALYGGLFAPSPPQQLQLYRELLHRQNIPDSFPRLLQEGSTSISVVNQSSTPPSK